MKFVVWKCEESVGSPADYDIVRNWLLPILEKAGNALKVVSMRLRGKVYMPPCIERYALCCAA